MKSRLTKRIVSLELKAAGSTPMRTFTDATTIAAGLEVLRRDFAACYAEIDRWDALSLVDQLQRAQDDLNRWLKEHAVQVANDGMSDDEGWLKLKEKFKRSRIQQLEAAMLHSS